MGPLDEVTQSRGTWGKDISAHWLARPVPWDFTWVELIPLVGSWGSLRAWLGGVSVRAGPLCRRSRLRASRIPQLPDTGQPAQARTQRSFQEELGVGRPGRPEAGEEGPICLCPVGQCPQSWECFIITSQGDCQQPSPLVETQVCVVLNRSRD